MGEEREMTALTLELVPFHMQGRVLEITGAGGGTGEFSETGSVSDGSVGLADAESCTICETAAGEAAGTDSTEGSWKVNIANRRSSFCSMAVKRSSEVFLLSSIFCPRRSARFSSLSVRFARIATEGGDLVTVSGKSILPVQRRQDIDGISIKKVVLVKRKLLFQLGSIDLRRRSRWLGR